MIDPRKIRPGLRVRFTNNLEIEEDPTDCGKVSLMYPLQGKVITVDRLGDPPRRGNMNFKIKEDGGRLWYSTAWCYELYETHLDDRLFEL